VNKRIYSFILAVFFLLLLVSCDKPEQPPVTEPPAVSDAPESTSPVTTSAPETVTAPSVSTAETAPVVPGRLLTAEGELKATPVKNLDLRAKCLVEYREGEDKAKVTVSLYLDHYSMTVGERAGCYLSVNGEKVKFTSPKISAEEESKTSTLLTEQTFELKKDKASGTFKMDLEAVYIFNGVYANTKITDITIKETVNLGS